MYDLILDEIYNFVMNKEPMKVRNFIFNGQDHYRPDPEEAKKLTPEQLEKLTHKLKSLSDPYERIKLMVKDKYGSFPKMDKKIGVSGNRLKYKRRLKNLQEVLDLIDLKISIVPK